MIRQRIEQALKTALLAGDKTAIEVLRSLKSAIVYAEVARGIARGSLSDEDVIAVLAKEAKKRQESADAFQAVGSQERAEVELREKVIIDDYLPKPLSREQIITLINGVLAKMGEVTPQTLGRVIGQVKERAGANSDGALIAQLVKERLAK